MLNKQKIKKLEESLNNLRGEQIHYCMKKCNEEVFMCEKGIYFNREDMSNDVCTGPKDILVIITDFGNTCSWDNY